jgi:hypothetical protein
MKKIIRIDGREYIQGSPAAKQAFDRACRRMVRSLQELRLDATFEREYDRVPRADETMFLARQLVFMSSEVQRVIYDKLRMAEFVPMKSESPEGAEQWGYRTQDWVGEALVGANLDADDAPLIDFEEGEAFFPFLNITAAYAYNVQELAAAAFAGRSLPSDKAMICAEVIARGINKVARVGKPDMGIFGFFNNPDVPVVTLTNGEWDTATPAEILADLAQIELVATTNNRDNYPFDTLVLPTTYDHRLRNLQIDDTSETTVAEYFFGAPGKPGKSRTFKNLERLIDLDDATGSDVAVDDPPMAIAYTKSDQVLDMDVPITYREEAPEKRNFKVITSARARASGVRVKQPKAMAYVKNLD